MNAAKKLRLITAKHMRNKETLLREWDNEIRKITGSLLDKRAVWSYYRERSREAAIVGLVEELHHMCLHHSHLSTHGTTVGARSYGS